MMDLKSQSKLKIDHPEQQGSAYRNINGIKCFVKWHLLKNKCKVTVCSKLHGKTMEYTFRDIEEDFKPKAAIKKL